MDPKALLKAFAEAGVDYVLVGGLAAALHGTTRVTQDIDIAYATHDGNLRSLCSALNRFAPQRMILGEPSGATFVLTPETLRRERVVQLFTTAGSIDLLDSIRGFNSYAAIKRLAQTEDLNNVSVSVLGIDGLIKAKRAMNRGKDIQDVLELEALKEVRKLDNSEGSIPLD